MNSFVQYFLTHSNIFQIKVKFRKILSNYYHKHRIVLWTEDYSKSLTATERSLSTASANKFKPCNKVYC